MGRAEHARCARSILFLEHTAPIIHHRTRHAPREDSELVVRATTSQDSAPTFGQRLRIQRNRRGMTREVLAGLVGRSTSWVKAVETDRLRTPRLAMLLRLSEVLQLKDLSELTGEQSLPTVAFTGPEHPRLAAVRAALNTLSLPASSQAQPVALLRSRLDRAWADRHASPNHREVLGGLLPDLIRDTHLAVHQADDPATRRSAQAIVAETHVLAHFFVVHQGAEDLVWRVSDRSMVAAQDSGDVHAIGIAALMMTMALREARDWDAADEVTSQALAVVEKQLEDGSDDLRAVYGALLFEYAFTTARRGKVAVAWNLWDEAERVSRLLPPSYLHRITQFSRAVMGAHAVTIAVESRAGGEAVRQAARATAPLPSRPRMARHQLEQARAYQLDNQPEPAMNLLEAAYRSAPETVRYHGYAHRLLLEELDSHSLGRRRRAAALAQRTGMVTS